MASNPNAPNVRLDRTSSYCPEQYDVYLNDEYFGYFRVRHGAFRVENAGGITILVLNTQGDGGFSESEREYMLQNGINILLEDRKNQNNFKI